MEFWRISNFQSLLGEGGLRAAGRWHSAGHRVVYLAQSPAGALLEVLVHLDLMGAQLPAGYTLLRIASFYSFDIATLAEVRSGDRWKQTLRASRQIGDAWLEQGSGAIGRIPSSILPHTSNYLLNPLHADAAKLSITEAIQSEFDERLLRHLRP